MKIRIPKFISEFTGHTYLHKYPLWFVYRPDVHRVRGNDVREILNIINPGDILLRRFDGYLNTVFTPGFWGHAGAYVGGNQVVHSVSEGCIQEDILNFCRADAIAVLAPYTGTNVAEAIKKAKDYADENVPYDYQFSETNKKYYCTELVDAIYNGIFFADYTETVGGMILMPDGIYNSKAVRLKLQINYKGVQNDKD